MKKRGKKIFPFSENRLPQILAWAAKHEYFSFLNGNKYQTLHGSFPDLLFIGKVDFIESSKNSFEKLNSLIKDKKDWLYGYFSYDLKNEIEKLDSKNPHTIPINHIGFYIPETVIKFKKNAIVIESFQDPDTILQDISESVSIKIQFETSPLTALTPKWKYINNVNTIKSSIVEGDFYEMNYCIEFTADATSFDPASCYNQLNSISPMPFSAFMRTGDTYLICASPERFVKKESNKIISQPIKGTSRRSFDKKEDEFLKQALRTSEKERAENLMIVDLVRNDLAKSAQTGSVKVEELFGIYTFNKVHQMISTITALSNSSIKISDIVKHAFPMGSMTGAPKIRVMEEIECLEDSARGLYSGAVGYIAPNEDFDFNVIIRSIIFNSHTNKISFHVGSAITYDSDPEYEYNECLLKAESLREVLT